MRTQSRRHFWPVLAAGTFGAAFMWLFDPDRGRGRRSSLGGQANRRLRRARFFLVARGHDLFHRARGVVARARRHAPVTDDIVLERVRSVLGHLVSHPRALEVLVEDGRVTVRGAILASEVDGLVKRVRHVPGVTEVLPLLDAHLSPAGVPSLQGGSPVREQRTTS